jgi:hypothetical protein
MWTKFKEFAHYADLATFNSLVFLYNVGIISSCCCFLFMTAATLWLYFYGVR